MCGVDGKTYDNDCNCKRQAVWALIVSPVTVKLSEKVVGKSNKDDLLTERNLKYISFWLCKSEQVLKDVISNGKYICYSYFRLPLSQAEYAQ